MPVYHWVPLKKQQHTDDFQRRTHTTGWRSRPAAAPPRAQTLTAPAQGPGRSKDTARRRSRPGARTLAPRPRQPGRSNHRAARPPLTSRATLGPARRRPIARPRPPRMRRGARAPPPWCGAARWAGLGWAGAMVGRAPLAALAHGAAGPGVGFGPASPVGVVPTQARTSSSQSGATRVVPLLPAPCSAL